MSTVRAAKNTGKLQDSQEKSKGKKGLPSPVAETGENEDTRSMAEILRELKELRKENKE